MPNTMKPAPLPSVYQLRVVVRGISPLIWRRLLVPADTRSPACTRCCRSPSAGPATTCTGSSSTGASTASPTSVASASATIRAGFGWAIWVCGRTERFTYRVRLHRRVVPRPAGRADPGRRAGPAPIRCCIGGRRAGPPEDCGGVWAFLERTQPHHVLAAAIRAAEILGLLLRRRGRHPVRASTARNSPACSRCWAWSGSTGGRLNRALAALAAAGTRAA